MKQGSLFNDQPTAYGVEPPLAANADPVSSHEAAEKHKASGKLNSHAKIALALVRRFPGSTYQELFAGATRAEKEELGDPVELMRRLSGLKEKDQVRQGVTRECQVKGNRMVVWFAV